MEEVWMNELTGHHSLLHLVYENCLTHSPKAVHLVSWSTALLDMLYARTPGNYKKVIKTPNEHVVERMDTKLQYMHFTHLTADGHV